MTNRSPRGKRENERGNILFFHNVFPELGMGEISIRRFQLPKRMKQFHAQTHYQVSECLEQWKIVQVSRFGRVRSEGCSSKSLKDEHRLLQKVTV